MKPPERRSIVGHTGNSETEFIHSLRLPRTRPARFERVQLVGIAVDNEGRIKLTNGVSVRWMTVL